MAKKSKIAKNERRKVIVARLAQRRTELKATIASPGSTPEQKAAAVSALQRMPRDASATRLRNRAAQSGRGGRQAARVLPRVRPVPHPAARNGPPGRTARRDEVELVKPMSTRQPRMLKRNMLVAAGKTEVDWKDVNLLREFISDRGKIRARRVTGLTPQQQRQVAVAIKNAREMAMLPYPSSRKG